MLERFREGVVEAERRMAEALGGDGAHELKARLQTYVDVNAPAGLARAEPEHKRARPDNLSSPAQRGRGTTRRVVA